MNATFFAYLEEVWVELCTTDKSRVVLSQGKNWGMLTILYCQKWKENSLPLKLKFHTFLFFLVFSVVLRLLKKVFASEFFPDLFFGGAFNWGKNDKVSVPWTWVDLTHQAILQGASNIRLDRFMQWHNPVPRRVLHSSQARTLGANQPLGMFVIPKGACAELEFPATQKKLRLWWTMGADKQFYFPMYSLHQIYALALLQNTVTWDFKKNI